MKTALLQILYALPKLFYTTRCKPSSIATHALVSTDKATGTAELGVGSVGLLVLLANRLSIDFLSDTQSRLDIVSLLACASIALDAVSRQGMLQIEREAVPAVGIHVNNTQSTAHSWLLNTILQAIPTSTTAYLVNPENGTEAIVGYTGSAGSNGSNLKPGPIVCSVMDKRSELYLPDLQILPGKIELSCLPTNCQAVFIAALSENNALVVGFDKAKSFDTRKLKMMRSLINIYGLLLKD